jgi:hypothetical protein
MNLRNILGVIIGITLVTALGVTTPMLNQVEGFIDPNGATFGPTLMLATNGTIGETAEEEPEEGE